MIHEINILKIRHLITKKEAAISQANMQTARGGGWLSAWDIVFNELDCEIHNEIENALKSDAESNAHPSPAPEASGA